MSLDAEYIFVYDTNIINYEDLINKDIKYLKKKYGGYITHFSNDSVYWQKSKHLLISKEYDNLNCYQILEKRGLELWEIIK